LISKKSWPIRRRSQSRDGRIDRANPAGVEINKLATGRLAAIGMNRCPSERIERERAKQAC